jgi:hypothetical protein
MGIDGNCASRWRPFLWAAGGCGAIDGGRAGRAYGLLASEGVTKRYSSSARLRMATPPVQVPGHGPAMDRESISEVVDGGALLVAADQFADFVIA